MRTGSSSDRREDPSGEIGAEHDVVVIGAGLSGLTAGALLARAGFDVAVLERADAAGGCARSFTREGVAFDPAVHVTIEGEPGGFIDRLLRHLGVAQQVVLERLPELYSARFPDLTLVAPAGREEFLAAHQELFPAQSRALAGLARMCAQLHEQTSALPQRLDRAGGVEAVLDRAPLLLRHRRSTVEEALAEHLDDDRACAAVSALWPHLGSAPHRLSFVLFNQLQQSMLSGQWAVRGGAQRLVDALVAALRGAGGRLVTGCGVERVLCGPAGTGHEVRGVRLADGSRVRTGTVVGAGDGTDLLARLVGWDLLPAGLRRRVERHRLAPSAVTLFGTLDGDPRQLGLRHESFVHRHEDHRRTWAEMQDGRPGGLWASVSAAAGDRRAVTVTGLVPADLTRDWRARRPRLAEEMVAAVDRAHPGFRDGFRLLETATPESYHRWTGNRGGAAFGWENLPSQIASRRLPHTTPVDGLLVCGHWSVEGESALRCLVSGRAAATLVARRLGRPDAVPPDTGPPSALRRPHELAPR